MNYTVEALDCKKKNAAAPFIDLSEAFDTIDRIILEDAPRRIGLSRPAVNWFSIYLSDRSQCVQSAGFRTMYLRGIPQGSLFGPLLFSHLRTQSP